MQSTAGASVLSYRIGELIRDSLRLFAVHVDVILGILALMAGAGMLSLLLLLIEPFWLGLLLAIPIGFLVFTSSYAALYRVALAANDQPVGIVDAYRAVLGYALLRFAWTNILVVVGTLLGLLLLVIPGLIFYCRYGLLAPVVTLAEGRSGIDALRRSRELAQGQPLARVYALSLAALFAMVLVPYLIFDDPLAEFVTDVIISLWYALGAVWPTLIYLRQNSPISLSASARARRSVPRTAFAAAAFLICVLLSTSKGIVEAFWLPSGSMIPTLEIGDHLLTNRLAYGFSHPLLGRVGPARTPRRGDLAVFVGPPGKNREPIALSKRIVAVGGDQVEIRNKQLMVNGEVQDEPYAHHFDDEKRIIPIRDNFGPLTIPPGHFFALGDNRDHSHDSRYWGTLPFENLRARVMFIYWSRQTDEMPRWDRIGKTVE